MPALNSGTEIEREERERGSERDIREMGKRLGQVEHVPGISHTSSCCAAKSRARARACDRGRDRIVALYQ